MVFKPDNPAQERIVEDDVEFTILPPPDEERAKQIIIKGGPGSGHFGHSGRPGKRGGSLPGGGGSSLGVGEEVYYNGKRGVVVDVFQDNLLTIADPATNDILAVDVKSDSVEKYSKKHLAQDNPQATTQELDEMWQQHIQAGGTPVWHGTSEEAARQILQEGFRATAAKDAESMWEERIGLPVQGDDRPAAVYFSTDRKLAESYGEGALSSANQRYAVIEFSVPESANEDVRFDQIEYEQWGPRSAFLIQGDVPADWISKVDLYEYRPGGKGGELVGTIER